MAELGVGKIASISGRYYAMDRDNRWDRVEKAYNVLTRGEGEQAESAVAAMDASYAKDVTDEFFVPTAITENGKPVATIKDKDTVIFFNFRPDRARELTRASVWMSLMVSREAQERMLLISASQNMTQPFQTKKLHSRR